MKYLLTILTTITGLLNVAESSEDFLRDQNSYSQDQDDVSQYELRDSSHDLSDSSQDLRDSSQDLDDSSHDITNNPEILNKYKTLKIIKDDEVNIKDTMTIKELLQKAEQCRNDIEGIKYDKSLTKEDKRNLFDELSLVIEEFKTPFLNMLGMLYYNETDDKDTLGILEANVCNWDLIQNSLNDYDIEMALDCLYYCIGEFEELPEQYLKLTIKQVRDASKQSHEQFLQKYKKKKVE